MKRIFLDWKRACLESAGEFLFQRYAARGSVNLAAVTVVLPGSRAGRRLLEILVARAEAEQITLVPPSIITVAGLAEQLVKGRRPVAGKLTRLLAWSDILRSATKESLEPILPKPPASGDLMAWWGIAELLERLNGELAMESLGFGDVVGATADPRWPILADLQEAYWACLEGLALEDPHQQRLQAVAEGRISRSREIVLIATADLNGATRQLLEAVSERVSILIHAPTELQDHFDAWGCIVPEAWQQATIDIPESHLVMADGPRDQVARLLELLSSSKSGPDQITIGVLDSTLLPLLEQKLARWELPCRSAVGRPLSASGPLRFLAALAHYLESRRFQNLAALLRHPDLESWLMERALGQKGKPPSISFPGAWIRELDAYQNEHLPAELGDWLGREQHSLRLRWAVKELDRLCAPLQGTERAVSVWSEPILKVLSEIYGQRFCDPQKPEQRQLLECCERLRDTLQSLHSIDPRLSPSTSAATALRLVARLLAKSTVPQQLESSAIELLGWLELHLDDAPTLVILSCNEAFLPGSVSSDPFLPNRLRRRLGLVDNARRYARDAYALSAILASRPEVRLICGRRTSAGDPLLPSRLLFAADPKSIALRVARCTAPATDHTSRRWTRLEPGSSPSRFPIPNLGTPPKPLTSMRVTAFRDYLACPYRFYLRHILALETLDDSAEELDPGVFGTLAHEVLNDFGKSELSAATEAGPIRALLDKRLDSQVA
ncbi:MAG: PD-(D/E)XK nuclease family protein, partial [Planctomycetota bacterium]